MNELGRKIVAYLQRHPDSEHLAIQRALGAHKTAIHLELLDLERAGLIRQTRRAAPRRWAATPLPPTEVAPPGTKLNPRRAPPAQPVKKARPRRTLPAANTSTVTVALPSGWKPASQESQLLYELPTPLRRLARR